MDRVIVYPGAIPLETDLLNTNRNAMIALGLLAQDILGTATITSGFAVVPTSPATLTVNVGPGRIYSQQNVDNTAYSSLGVDTAAQIVKQGVTLANVNLACPAPTTSGQSINYLIEAEYQDLDGGSTVLPYYNAANPAQAYSGPGNTGAANYTVRQGTVSLIAKAGTAATTGSQTTPAPDAGYTGIAVVTVAYGATTIVNGNITAYSGANALSTTLPGIIAAVNALGGSGSGYLTASAAAATYQTIAAMSSYLTAATAASTYLTQANAASTYETIGAAASTYLPITTAASTYLSQTNAASTYLTQANAAATYLAAAAAASTYLSQSAAAATYLTIASAASTYLTAAAAASTYATPSYVAANFLSSSGVVPNANLPKIGSLPGVTIQADPGTTPSGSPGQMFFCY